MNILAGPQTDLVNSPGSEVSCDYVEPREEVHGFAPKFQCKLKKPDELVRVKYNSREVVAEVLASRLVWALGFYADANYPAAVRCRNCPEKNPFHPSRTERRIDLLIKTAMIERTFPGKVIVEYEDQGWKWEELDLTEETLGGATKSERDALKLLMVLIQHTDSKPSQQRLACYENDVIHKFHEEFCKRPVFMVQDLGSTFGKGNEQDVIESSSMDFGAWKNQPVWNLKKEEEYREKNHQNACFGNLQAAWHNGLNDPQISEGGRAFLSSLLFQLTDRQIHELFTVARVDVLEETISENDQTRPVTTRDWVEAFKKKRDEIRQHKCL